MSLHKLNCILWWMKSHLEPTSLRVVNIVCLFVILPIGLINCGLYDWVSCIILVVLCFSAIFYAHVYSMSSWAWLFTVFKGKDLHLWCFVQRLTLISDASFYFGPSSITVFSYGYSWLLDGYLCFEGHIYIQRHTRVFISMVE